MPPHRVVAWLAGVVLVVSTLLALGGCFLVSWLPDRSDPAPPVSGPAVSVERCQVCHAAPVVEQYAQSIHTAKGIRCGQCHTPGGHPNYTQPVQDGKCGGCHQPAYQQTLASEHFAGRQLRSLDGDRAARATLRGEGFITATAGGRRFVGDSTSGELGGRLCAACHYDEHRLGLGAVQGADFCVGCHADLVGHFPIPTPSLTNRCTRCHVRAGTTESGQVINTHQFARPGGVRAGR